jgi:hypothetical protein
VCDRCVGRNEPSKGDERPQYTRERCTRLNRQKCACLGGPKARQPSMMLKQHRRKRDSRERCRELAGVPTARRLELLEPIFVSPSSDLTQADRQAVWTHGHVCDIQGLCAGAGQRFALRLRNPRDPAGNQRARATGCELRPQQRSAAKTPRIGGIVTRSRAGAGWRRPSCRHRLRAQAKRPLGQDRRGREPVGLAHVPQSKASLDARRMP